MVTNDSWFNWSVRPNGWSWQQDMIWHHCLWIRVKDMDIHENSSSTQILHSYWFKFLDLKKKVVSGGRGEQRCAPLVCLCLGLGDSPHNTVQDSKVLWKDQKWGVFASGFLMRMTKISAHTRSCLRDGTSSINTKWSFLLIRKTM